VRDVGDVEKGTFLTRTDEWAAKLVASAAMPEPQESTARLAEIATA